MRPLMAAQLVQAADLPSVGIYNELLAVTLDQAGRPIVERGGTETLTFVVKEPADDERYGSLETITKVAHEPADDNRVLALETATRTVNEPADDDRAWARAALPPSDDCASGLVSF
jgi:hypothetical protein